MKTTGVIIARFQTPYLHEGHLYLLNEIKTKHDRVIVILGTTTIKGSRRSPYDYDTRKAMLAQYDATLTTLQLQDHPSDIIWSRHLDNILEEHNGEGQFVLYGSRDCFIPSYSGKWPVVAVNEKGDFSATNIREEAADSVLRSEDFRLGINYAYHHTYPKVYATVDIAVMKDNDQFVLMAKKPDAIQWRFPGGFSDPEDESYEMAALREMKEECGDIETGEAVYVASARIDDWRYRREADKIISSLYKTKYISGTPEPMDDIAELSWIEVASLMQKIDDDEISPDHVVLVRHLLKSL